MRGSTISGTFGGTKTRQKNREWSCDARPNDHGRTLTLCPIWRIVHLSRPWLHLSASAQVVPEQGPSCGLTCLGRRFQCAEIPLKVTDAPSHSFWNTSQPPDNSVTNWNSSLHIFLLHVLASERAYLLVTGKLAAAPHSHTHTTSSLNTSSLLLIRT